MIEGYFTADGRPRVRTRVLLPRFEVVNEVHFPVDTGLDTTILHPQDGNLLGCPFDEPVNPVVSLEMALPA